MPDNGSGTYTLVDTVTNATTIDADELNTIFQDLADALTNRLAVDGQSTATGVIKFANGSASAPALTFGSDTNTGFYRISADTIGVAVAGALVATLDANGLTLATGKTFGSTADIIANSDNLAANVVTLAKLATIADATILANTTGGASVPVATTLTAILDDMMGSTRGQVLRRGTSAWEALTLGTSGYIFKSDGTDAAWAAATDVGLPSQSGNSGKVLTTNGTSSSWGALAPTAYGTALTLTTTPAIESGGLNMGTPTVPSTGVVRFNFSSALASANYTPVVTFISSAGATYYFVIKDRATTYVEFYIRDSAGTLTTPVGASCVVFGGF